MTQSTLSETPVWQRPEVVASFLTGSRRVIPLAETQFETVIRVIDAHDLVVQRFIDLGAGSGTLAAQILARFPEADATLVDFSPAMLDAARTAFASTGLEVRIVEADLTSADWHTADDRGSYDAVVSGFAIHHLQDEAKRQVYRTAFELLRPGGLFINVEHVKSASPELSGAFDRLMIEALLAGEPSPVTPERTEEVVTAFHRRQDKDVNILAPVSDQLRWLTEIGFEGVDCYFKYFELAIFGGRKPLGR